MLNRGWDCARAALPGAVWANGGYTMNKMYTVILTLAAFAMLVHAHAADACLGTPTPELTIPYATGADGGALYIDNDLCHLSGSTFSMWVSTHTTRLARAPRALGASDAALFPPEAGHG